MSQNAILTRNTLDGPIDLVKVSIERIKEHEPTKGYRVSNSFGKDSGVIMKLMELAEVNYEAHHNFTTVDPPQLIRHGMKNYPDTLIDRPEISMWALIEKKGFPPTRVIRYCCDYLKEKAGRDCLNVMGKRREESAARSQIPLLEQSRKNKWVKFLNPILDWTAEDVWNFTTRYNVPYCELYRQGFTRLGCVMCPKAGGKQMEYEAAFFPKHYTAYLRAFSRAMKTRPDMAEHFGFTSPVDMMHWWMWESHIKEDRTTQQILFADPAAGVV